MFVAGDGRRAGGSGGLAAVDPLGPCAAALDTLVSLLPAEARPPALAPEPPSPAARSGSSMVDRYMAILCGDVHSFKASCGPRSTGRLGTAGDGPGPPLCSSRTYCFSWGWLSLRRNLRHVSHDIGKRELSVRGDALADLDGALRGRYPSCPHHDEQHIWVLIVSEERSPS